MGFVEDQQLRIVDQRPADFDELLLGEREGAELRVRIERDPEPRHRGGRVRPDRPPIHERAHRSGLLAEVDILGDGHVGREHDLLEHDRDAAPVGVPRAGQMKLFVAEHEPARGRPLRAGDHLHQGRLSGAVLADDRVNGSGMNVEGHVLQRHDAGINLRHVVDAKQNGHGRFSGRLGASGVAGGRAGLGPYFLSRKDATFAALTTSTPVSVTGSTVSPFDSLSRSSIEPVPMAYGR